jgi:hypothetical protein
MHACAPCACGPVHETGREVCGCETRTPTCPPARPPAHPPARPPLSQPPGAGGNATETAEPPPVPTTTGILITPEPINATLSAAINQTFPVNATDVGGPLGGDLNMTAGAGGEVPPAMAVEPGACGKASRGGAHAMRCACVLLRLFSTVLSGSWPALYPAPAKGRWGPWPPLAPLKALALRAAGA